MSKPLPRCRPADVGVDPQGVLNFIEGLEANRLEVHGMVLQRHGKVFAEGYWSPYSADRPHILYSLSKSFTSTAIGFAIAEGYVSLDDLVVSLFPDDLPDEISPNLAAMKVRHLLSMSCGHADEPQVRDQENWARAFLAHPVPNVPGTTFVYNSLSTYMCSAIVQSKTGQTVLDYLRPRLLDPLGIEQATWERCPRGINVGGWGLSVTTDTIARFGLLYLRDGVWEGKRILPEGWVATATAKHVSNGDDPNNDWTQGYGFQFWRSRHGAYRGDGAFGQYCVVMQDQDAVLAFTSGENNMGEILNQAWLHLLPAMEGPVASEVDAQPRLESLCLRKVDAGATGRKGVYYYERSEGAHRLDSIRFEFADDATNLSYWAGGKEHCHRVGNGEWINEQAGDRTVSATGGWTDADTYAVRMTDLGGPFGVTYTCRFDGDALTIDFDKKGVFGPLEVPTFHGRLTA